MRRVRELPRDPNPLFLAWLEEWEEEARRKGKFDLANIYNHCQQNLTKYPLPLENGLQCKIIVGFGKNICAKLEDRLQRHRQADAGQSSSLPLKEKSSGSGSGNSIPLCPISSSEAKVDNPKYITSHLPSFPLSPVAPKSPPFRCIENLRLSPSKNSSIPKSFPVTISPSRPKQPVETQDESFKVKSKSSHAAFSSMASVFDSPPPNRATSTVFTESWEEREARELATALARSKADASDQAIDPDLEYAKRVQKELEEDEERQWREMGAHNTDELPDIEENAIEKTAEEREAEDLELALSLSREQMGSHTDKFEGENQGHLDVEVVDDDQKVRHLEVGLSVGQQMIGGENALSVPEASSSGTQNVLSNSAPRVGKFGGVGEKKRIQHRSLLKSPDISEGEDEWASEALQEFSNKDKVFKGSGRGGGRLKGGKNSVQTERDSDIGNTTRGRGRKRTVGREELLEGVSTPTRTKRKRGGGGTPSSESRKKGGGASGRKEYVPKTRSGAYAVLLTLVKEEADDSWRGYLSTTELKTKAQPLCDESLTHTSVHREHYSAWSSVRTLLKHELVAKWSNPAKFKATDKGRELAMRILRLEEGGFDEDLPAAYDDPIMEERRNEQNSSDDEDMRRAKELSMQTFRPDFSLGSSFAGELSPDPTQPTDRLESSKSERKISKASSTSAPPIKATSVKSISAGSSTSTGADSLPLTLRLHQMARQASETSRPARDTFTPQFKLSRGCFEIVLCVDNTETSGGGAGGRKSLKTETERHLKNTGVQFDKRGLNIGDFLWVAREKLSEVGGQFRQPQRRELVLPFLVERKRQDDLWQSVKDGRYQEQKFRMKNSGLEHLFYLVEEYQKHKSFVGDALTLEQAVANTAVQEGFSIKRTSDQRGTIEYLTLMTRLLREKYKEEELVCITKADLEEGKVRSRDTALLEFQAFNEASKKTKKLTVRDVFAKTLLRMKGLSAEMAEAIVETYPCPALLRRALLAVPEPSRLPLLTNIKVGKEGKRKLPKAIAEAVIKFWTSDSLL